MTGYYTLVDSPSERVRTGLTFIHFGYDKDLSGYTLARAATEPATPSACR